jgi:hypothetical protein
VIGSRSSRCEALMVLETREASGKCGYVTCFVQIKRANGIAGLTHTAPRRVD